MTKLSREELNESVGPLSREQIDTLALSCMEPLLDGSDGALLTMRLIATVEDAIKKQDAMRAALLEALIRMEQLQKGCIAMQDLSASMHRFHVILGI